MNLIETDALYVTTPKGAILVYSEKNPVHSLFRMKPNTIFTVLKNNIELGRYGYAKILIATTGEIYILYIPELEGYLARNLIQKIG
jgi:hypothetical protein